MKEKTRLLIGGFLILFVFIGAAGWGWNRLLNQRLCDFIQVDISRQSDRLESFVFNYQMFGDRLSEEKQTKIKNFIEAKEPLFKKSVETYSQECRGGADRKPLFHALKNFEYYLVSKQTAFGDQQPEGYSWLAGFMEFADLKKN